MIPKESKANICDLCCGSGAIGISVAHYRKNTFVDLIDYYEQPEKVTLMNINRNEVNENTKFIRSDLLTEAINMNKKYDVIISNPPYIEDD